MDASHRAFSCQRIFAISANGTTDTTSYAVFGDGSYKLTDRLTFDAGLRATSERKHGRASGVGWPDRSDLIASCK